MKMLTRSSLGVIALLMLMATKVEAQPRQMGVPPPRRPAVPIWLDIAGTRGNQATFQLYQRIQPRLQFQNSIQNLQQQLSVTQSEIAQSQAETTLPGTGHATMFMNLGGYFQSSGGAALRPARSGAGGAAQRGGRTAGAAGGARGGRR